MAPDPHQPPSMRPRFGRLPGKRISLAAALAGAAVAAAALGVSLAGDGNENVRRLAGAPNEPFRIDYPKSWQPLSREELAGLPGSPLAVLRRKDGKGLVVVRKGGPVPRDLAKLARQLGRELRKRVPDFKQASAKRVRTRAGEAFFYSYIRKRTGTVHAVVIAPGGSSNYVLNTVSQGRAQDVAREIGVMISSFSAPSRRSENGD